MEYKSGHISEKDYAARVERFDNEAYGQAAKESLRHSRGAFYSSGQLRFAVSDASSLSKEEYAASVEQLDNEALDLAIQESGRTSKVVPIGEGIIDSAQEPSFTTPLSVPSVTPRNLSKEHHQGSPRIFTPASVSTTALNNSNIELHLLEFNNILFKGINEQITPLLRNKYRIYDNDGNNDNCIIYSMVASLMPNETASDIKNIADKCRAKFNAQRADQMGMFFLEQPQVDAILKILTNEFKDQCAHGIRLKVLSANPEKFPVDETKAKNLIEALQHYHQRCTDHGDLFDLRKPIEGNSAGLVLNIDNAQIENLFVVESFESPPPSTDANTDKAKEIVLWNQGNHFVGLVKDVANN